MAAFLARERIIAGPRFNRWLVPPTALAMHLCIGMAYGFSVFWLPLSKAIGITSSVACSADTGVFAMLVTTSCDWPVKMLGWTYTLFFVLLGLSAALWGGWLERAGPRRAGVVAAACWSGGFLVSALGIATHQLWLMWLGSGVIGGIGLGLGYISPVSTLIKWFPDRRGMATGMAIMGFGGGAMIGSPLADILMKHFATATSVGVWQTFVTLGLVYFVFMMSGALGYRVPREDWRPAGWTAPSEGSGRGLVTQHNVALDVAWRSRQFWLVWAVLCLNVTAGIGILGMASPLLQEVFGGRLIGVSAGFTELDQAQLAQIATLAAGFTGLLSLFNIVGRIFWASLSDRLGRKATYATFFLLGIALYGSIPWLAGAQLLGLFVAFMCVIVSMYGGGFSTVPAYLADLFGTKMVGAIHGRLLTAWSAAGIFGPVIVNYLRDYQIQHGVARESAYNTTMYILAGLLVAGFVCNWLVRPVPHASHLKEEAAPPRPAAGDAAQAPAKPIGGNGLLIVMAWAAVWIPIGWGVWMTLTKAIVLIRARG
jgi:MFS family permease